MLTIRRNSPTTTTTTSSVSQTFFHVSISWTLRAPSQPIASLSSRLSPSMCTARSSCVLTVTSPVFPQTIYLDFAQIVASSGGTTPNPTTTPTAAPAPSPTMAQPSVGEPPTSVGGPVATGRGSIGVAVYVEGVGSSSLDTGQDEASLLVRNRSGGALVCVWVRVFLCVSVYVSRRSLTLSKYLSFSPNESLRYQSVRYL